MSGRKEYSTILVIFIVVILLTVVGCSRRQNSQPQDSAYPQQDTKKISTDERDLQQTNKPVMAQETTALTQNIFVQMLANHPLYRHGELSPDNRYYAYEERSSIILVQLPAAEEYEADKNLLPKVLFTDGIRKESSFAELEADYARRLHQPLLTEEERNEARSQLRSVYDWRNFYYQKFSQDGHYLAYLGFDNFGSNMTCTVYVLDIKDNNKLYTLPIKEISEYAEINWQADNQTLELYLPWAEAVEEGYLALRRQWHLPSGRSQLKYYIQNGTGEGPEVALADAQKAISEHRRAEKEWNQAMEEWNKLTVEEQVAALSPDKLAEEYAKYKDLPIYDPKLIQTQNSPPEAIKQEIVERGLPNDLTSQVAKEFYGWENMLAYTNEAILAIYEAVQQSNAIFGKEEAYRLAVRAAYLGR